MATTKVSALTSKATLTGPEEILINDGGTSKKSTVAAVTATNTAAIALNTAKTGITSGQASEITANTAKVTNATHTGDVTGATALTIAAGAVDIAMLSAGGTAGGTTYLRGDNQWATVASGNITTSGLYEMANIIASNYSIASGNNAISAGPITINTGIAVTVPSGSTWVIA